ncbi:Rv0361 family membrane protein [Nocardia stercoris]|uniref:DUF4878 domain-containing protein n=1 Tax=Nocardia stercoris TaxID=2483361 RepID=A0A3M2L4A2_9NOCA|nr:hypothetical protein [Nocardia stercoris]RMI29338.1 hypothetical protein EBN03_26810 [Nocardia stercoris]
MSESDPAANTPADPEPDLVVDQADTRSATPFIAAAVVAVLVLIGIFVAGALRPADRNVTQADRIADAVRNFALAQSDSDSGQLAANTCTGFDATRSPLGADTGKRVEIVSVTDPNIDGDRGKATVTSKVEGGQPSTGVWNLVRQGSAWKVCDGN